jgi:purine catabolism regulator
MSTPSPSLSELIRLSFTEPATWLTGSRDTTNAFNWVATSLEEARPGDILVVSQENVDNGLLAESGNKRLAALLVLGNPDLDGKIIPDGLAIIALEAELEARAAQRDLLTILINQRAMLMERGVRIHGQLSQLAAQGEGLDGLARAMGDITGRGILVQDKRLQILAQRPSPALVSIWEDILRQLDTPESLPELLRDRKEAGRHPLVITQDMPGSLARLVVPITVGEMARGYLSLVGMPGELDALDHLVAEQGALVCAIEMARAKAVREAEKRLTGNLLTALLEENLSPRDARLWAQSMGLDLHQAHVALRFAWDGPSPPSRRRLETLVNGEVTRIGLRVVVNAMGAEVICFCQVPLGRNRPEIALAFAQSVLDQEMREFPDTNARCGVGTAAQDLSEWRTSFRQAGQALEMARRLGEIEPLFFSDLSVYRLLMQIEHNPELIAFQEEILGPLLAYEGGAELIRTLEAYFEHNGNLSQAAEALFIHRNTLIYRMERIAGITDLDLDKPETRLAVQLALHIYRMTGSTRG